MFATPQTVWRAVAMLIEELDCADRCVEYSVEGSVQSYDSVDAWLSEAIANGRGTIRYVVDPDHLGLVRVDFVSAPTSA